MKENNPKIEVGLVEDHALIRDALATVIDNFETCLVTLRCDNGKDLMEKLPASKMPPVIILDINMPEMDGYDTAKWIKENYPEIHIIILTMFDSEIALIRLLQTGVKAFLKKDTQPRELKYAIESVVRNGYYYSQ